MLKIMLAGLMLLGLAYGVNELLVEPVAASLSASAAQLEEATDGRL